MNTFQLRIVATDGIFFEGRARSIIIPAIDGEVEILANHEDMVIAVDSGEVRFQVKDEKEWHAAVVGSGFIQIINNRALLLVQSCERPEDIDAVRAEEARLRAEEQMRQKMSIQEYYRNKALLSRAMSRLKVASKYKH